jgi:hypothetical protein
MAHLYRRFVIVRGEKPAGQRVAGFEPLKERRLCAAWFIAR